MNKKILMLGLTALLLTGCGSGDKVGPIDVPAKQSGNLLPIPSTLTTIKNIYIEYQFKFEVRTAAADFEPKGIVPGVQSPMVPLDEDDSQMQSLGFTTHISNDGEEALLIYNDSSLKFKVGDKTLFLNDTPGIQMVDAPIYNNSTIYVPIIPILDALKIDYEIVGQDLTIGGMYTDDAGDTRNSGE